MNKPWIRYILDPSCIGGACDLLFVDLDSDGERELVANTTYSLIQLKTRVPLNMCTIVKLIYPQGFRELGTVELKMKPQLFCLPCTLRTAYDIATRATDDEKLQREILLETARWMADPNNYEEVAAPALHTQVSRIAKRITGNPDPFVQVKRISNKRALEVLPILKREVQKLESFQEAFQLAVKGTICGNAIDFEVENYCFSLEDLEPSILNCLEEDLAIDDTPKFMGLLSKSKKVLYLLDNAGEILFDKFLIKIIRETYPCEVWAAVKDKSVLNDATIDDVEQVSIKEVARVVSTGNDHIGVRLEESSEEFLKHLKTADLIVAKGQGHYESVTEIGHVITGSVCYLLRVKCTLVAQALGVPLNSNVVKVEIG